MPFRISRSCHNGAYQHLTGVIKVLATAGNRVVTGFTSRSRFGDMRQGVCGGSGFLDSGQPRRLKLESLLTCEGVGVVIPAAVIAAMIDVRTASGGRHADNRDILPPIEKPRTHRTGTTAIRRIWFRRCSRTC